MAEENKKPKTEEKKVLDVNVPVQLKKKSKTEDKSEKTEAKAESPKDEAKLEEKVEKKAEVQKPKKEEAVAHGVSLRASKKHCMYICKFIMNKKIDDAIKDLQDVIKYKKHVPFKGEIPHRKGKGAMSGRYPISASKIFINLLKGLKGNVLVNGLDLDKTRICYGSPSWASRPMRNGWVSAKRTNLIIKAKEIQSKGEKK